MNANSIHAEPLARRRMSWFPIPVFLALGIWWMAAPPPARADDDFNNGSANIGERLFLETRFAEFFYTNSGGDANAILTNGDPAMNTSATIYGPLPGPFAGQSMNCRACHLVEEQENNSYGVLPAYDTGNRTYCDFAQRSPIPDVGDGRITTPRNAMPLVDSLLPRSTPLFLHFDGQFATPQDLVIGTLTGRNYGWNPTQYATAIHHIAHIIRDDDGSGGLAQQYGGWSYSVTFEALAEVEYQYQIAPPYRMDVAETDTNSPNYVTDEQIVQNVAALIQAYLETLVFLQDTNGNFNGSPYDNFLILNNLPQQPNPGETSLQYSQRLFQLITNLTNPRFVTDPADGSFMTQNQSFQFGTNELAGLKIFFSLFSSNSPPVAGTEVGNCVACHAPPAFSDFLFHNNGAEQEEYDAVHGKGAFLALAIPSLAQRLTNYNACLPPTTNHPYALGTFETPPNTNNAGQVDLGLWNVFANPDFPAPQPGLQQVIAQITPPPTPQIAGTGMSGNNFSCNGFAGTPGWTYYVIGSTNLALPMTNWTVIATNTFDSQGNFSFTQPVNPGASPEFYSLVVDSQGSALPYTVALFKTPTVRDISSSEPYLHTGRMDTVEDVINFYINSSALARAGQMRNADPQLNGIFLDANAVAPLAAFLRSLNEDYTDVPCPCQ